MSFSLGLKDAVKFSVEIEILEYVISAVGFSNTTNSETIENCEFRNSSEKFRKV